MIALQWLVMSAWVSALAGSAFGLYYFGAGAQHALCVCVFVISAVRTRTWFGFR